MRDGVEELEKERVIAAESFFASRRRGSDPRGASSS
jgi:hypothetical protein